MPGRRPSARLLDQARATRPMLWIMGIMLFLTALATAGGLGIASAADVVSRQIAGRLTVQLVEASDATRDAEAAAALVALRADPHVRRADPVDQATLARLVQPWMGQDAADPDLPMPALIDVDLADPGVATLSEVSARVKAAAPSARVDRHERWMSPVSRLMGMLIGLAAAVVVLMAAATAAVVLLAARAGLDTYRDTISVLHMLGSTDVQIARLFQQRIARDTLIGGVVGTALAALVIAGLGSMAGGLDSEMLGSTRLGSGQWALIALLPFAFTALAAAAARVAVLGVLRRVL